MAITKVSRGLLSTGVSDSSDATAITIDSSERVGIGVTSLSQKLEVSGNVGITDNLGVGTGSSSPNSRLQIKKDGTSNYANQTFSNANSTAGITFGIAGSGTGNYLADNAFLLNTGSSAFIFGTGDVERMRIDSSGRVGIGTTSPDAMLKVVSNSNAYAASWIRGDQFGLRVSAGSTSSHYALRIANSSDTTLATFNGDGKVGIGTSSPGYLFHVNNSASGGTSFQFQGNGPNLYTAMTNTSATNYIGVNGTQWEFYCGGTLKFQINTTNGGQTVSDQKFKKDIEDISYGLDTVKALQPRKFKWKENDESTIGFIAQEVKPVISEIITEPLQSPEGLENGMTLNYSALTAVLTKAIQEQQEQIEALQSEINTLKGGE